MGNCLVRHQAHDPQPQPQPQPQLQPNPQPQPQPHPHPLPQPRHVTNLLELPDNLISAILFFTTPRDVCRLAVVSKSSRSVSYSDSVWNNFLPQQCYQIPRRAVTPFQFFSKRELYFRLCDPIPIEGGTKIFWLERSTAKIGYMLSPKELHIVWGQGQRYWRWVSRADSRFQDVPELIGVHWLEIKGGIDCRLLSADTQYRVLFEFKFGEDTSGWNEPIKFSLTTPEGQEIESKELVVGREAVAKHEWMEGVAGEFRTSSAEDICDEDSYIEFCMTEVVAEWKGGLVIHGVRIEAKST